MAIQEKLSKAVVSEDELRARATPEAISDALREIPAATLGSALAAEHDAHARAHAVRLLLVVEHLRRSEKGDLYVDEDESE
jgi:hypothetical protein